MSRGTRGPPVTVGLGGSSGGYNGNDSTSKSEEPLEASGGKDTRGHRRGKGKGKRSRSKELDGKNVVFK